MGNSMNDRTRILLDSLKAHGSDDVSIPYRQVALLFPSSVPHPSSFEYTVIDYETLLAWGFSHGWEITPLPELSTSNDPQTFPIRFRRSLPAGLKD